VKVFGVRRPAPKREFIRRLMTGNPRHLLFPFSILFALVPIMAAAQSGGSFTGGSFKLRVDVDLVTIEVYALDSKGKPVRNLKKEDFRLFEDGKEQEIISFDAVDEKTNMPAAPLPVADSGDFHHGKTVLIVFDDSTIPALYFKTSRDIASRFVREHMQPDDLFAVACWNMSMQVFQNLTDDREEVLAAIARTAHSPTVGGFIEDMLRSLERINDSLAPLKGQKSVLLFGKLGYYSGPTLSETYDKTLTSAKRSNVLYYTVDPGATTGDINAGFMGTSSQSMPGGIVPVTLRSLASASGGASLLDTNDINKELDRLDQQISNYYILGFQPNNPKHDGAFRNIKVKTEAKGITLKHRPGYQDKSPIDALAKSKQEQTLLTTLASPSAATQVPIAFRPVYFYDSPKSARVLVPTRIRLEKTEFRKRGSQIGVDLSIMGVAYAEDGSIAARFSETIPVVFDREKELEVRKANLVYQNYFKLRPGKYRLKLAVSDESNNLGSVEQSLQLPAFPEQGFAGSSIVIAEQTSRLPDLIQNLQAQMLDASDPLLYSGIQFEPSVLNRVPAGSSVPMLFRIYNLPGSPDQWNLQAKAKLLDQNGREYPLGLIHLKDSMSRVGKGEAVVVLQVSFPGVPPGNYRLVLETSETASSQTATLQTDIEFVK